MVGPLGRAWALCYLDFTSSPYHHLYAMVKSRINMLDFHVVSAEFGICRFHRLPPFPLSLLLGPFFAGDRARVVIVTLKDCWPVAGLLQTSAHPSKACVRQEPRGRSDKKHLFWLFSVTWCVMILMLDWLCLNSCRKLYIRFYSCCCSACSQIVDRCTRLCSFL